MTRQELQGKVLFDIAKKEKSTTFYFAEIPTGTGKTKILLDAASRRVAEGRSVVIATSNNLLALAYLDEAEKFGVDAPVRIRIGKDNYVDPVIALSEEFRREFGVDAGRIRAWFERRRDHPVVQLFVEDLLLPDEAGDIVRGGGEADIAATVEDIAGRPGVYVTNHHFLIHLLRHGGSALAADVYIDEAHLLPAAALSLFRRSFSPWRLSYLMRSLAKISGAATLKTAMKKFAAFTDAAKEMEDDAAVEAMRAFSADPSVERAAKVAKKLTKEPSLAQLARKTGMELGELFALGATTKKIEVSRSPARGLPSFTTYDKNPIYELRKAVANYEGFVFGVSGTFRVDVDPSIETNRWSFERLGLFPFKEPSDEKELRFNRRIEDIAFSVYPRIFPRENLGYVLLKDDRFKPPKTQDETLYKKWIEALAEVAASLFAQTKKSGMVLMSSFENSAMMAEAMRKQGIEASHEIFLHEERRPLRAVIADYKKRVDSGVNAVLVGGLPLFTGVDLAGKYLEALFIGKLPFEPKEDYFSRIRYGSYSAQGDMVRKAVMTFRQGVGRAIRSKDDRAVVVVGDPRIKNPRYRVFERFLDEVGVEVV